MLGILPDYSRSNPKVKIFNRHDINVLSDLGFINIEPPKDTRKIDREKFITVPKNLISVPEIMKKRNKVNTLEKRNEIDGDSGKNIFEATGLEELDEEDKKETANTEDYDGDWQYMYRVASKKYYWNKGVLYNVKDGKTDTEITQEEYAEILEKAKSGDEKAREKFVMMNIGLIYNVVINQRKIYKKYSLSEQVSAGLEELNNCIDKYKLDKENPAKFSTFARMSLQFKLFRNWINTKNEVSVPQYVNSKIIEIMRAEKAVQGIIENDSDLHFKVAKRLGVPYLKLKEKIQETMMYAKFVNFEDNLKEVDRYNLDTGEMAEDFLENILKRESKEDVDQALLKITPQQRVIIEMRFGLGKNESTESTFKEVGKVFNLTRERIRQIEGVAIRKIMNFLYEKNLKSYIMEHKVDLATSDELWKDSATIKKNFLNRSSFENFLHGNFELNSVAHFKKANIFCADNKIIYYRKSAVFARLRTRLRKGVS